MLFDFRFPIHCTIILNDNRSCFWSRNRQINPHKKYAESWGQSRCIIHKLNVNYSHKLGCEICDLDHFGTSSLVFRRLQLKFRSFRHFYIFLSLFDISIFILSLFDISISFFGVREPARLLSNRWPSAEPRRSFWCQFRCTPEASPWLSRPEKDWTFGRLSLYVESFVYLDLRLVQMWRHLVGIFPLRNCAMSKTKQKLLLPGS